MLCLLKSRWIKFLSFVDISESEYDKNVNCWVSTNLLPIEQFTQYIFSNSFYKASIRIFPKSDKVFTKIKAQSSVSKALI